jgi:hypothetical protein
VKPGLRRWLGVGIKSAAKGWPACYYAGDPHWNAYGNEVAAACIRNHWDWYSEKE